MEEIILKMLGCLVAALTLGFIFGWLIKRAFDKENYEPKIEALEASLSNNKTLLEDAEKESTLIKEQFLTTKDALEISNTKVSSLQTTLENKELDLASAITRKTSLEAELNKTTVNMQSQVEETARVKEHHALLKNEMTKLEQDKGHMQQELAKLSQLLSDTKDSEASLKETNSAHENKLQELKQVLNEKNAAAMELNTKIKEIDRLNLKTSALTTELESAKSELNKAEETTLKYKNALNDIEKRITENKTVTHQEVGHIINNSDKLNTAKSEGFDFKTFAQKAIKKITETGDDINKQADKVIQEYKDKKNLS